MEKVTIATFLTNHAGEILVAAGGYAAIISGWFIRLVLRQRTVEIEIKNLVSRHEELKDDMKELIEEFKEKDHLNQLQMEQRISDVSRVITENQTALIQAINNRFDDLKDLIKVSKG